MKIGYQIQIQKDLSDIQKELAREYIENWITWPDPRGDSCWKTGEGPNYFRRNSIGKVINYKAPFEEQITFRRISKNRRIFGVVKLSLLKFKKMSCAYYTQKDLVYGKEQSYGENWSNCCKCDRCISDYVMSMPERPEMEIYYTYGEIKG